LYICTGPEKPNQVIENYLKKPPCRDAPNLRQLGQFSAGADFFAAGF